MNFFYYELVEVEQDGPKQKQRDTTRVLQQKHCKEQTIGAKEERLKKIDKRGKEEERYKQLRSDHPVLGMT